jgi:hypothetical protein
MSLGSHVDDRFCKRALRFAGLRLKSILNPVEFIRHHDRE